MGIIEAAFIGVIYFAYSLYDIGKDEHTNFYSCEFEGTEFVCEEDIVIPESLVSWRQENE